MARLSPQERKDKKEKLEAAVAEAKKSMTPEQLANVRIFVRNNRIIVEKTQKTS